MIRRFFLLLCLLLAACGGGSEGLAPAADRAAWGEAVGVFAEGRFRQAVAAFAALRDAEPEHLGTRVYLARALIEERRLAPAEAELQVAGTLAERHPAVEAAWVALLREQGDVLAARTRVEAALERDAGAGDLHREAGLLAFATGGDATAVAHFERMGDAADFDALLLWARAIEASGDLEVSLRRYEAALSRAPDYRPDAHLGLGSLLLRRGGAEAFPRAVELLEEAVARRPDQPDALHQLGRARLATSQVVEARNLLRRAVDATPVGDPALAERLEDLERTGHRGRRSAPADAPNVVLIVVDTLRRDHLRLYGYERPTSPTIDRLGREGVVVEQAIAPAPWTAPSIATLFTGLYPSVHGLDGGVRWGVRRTAAGGQLPFAVQKTLSPGQVTLAELLRRNGYATAGFVSNTYVNAIFGFSQGFEVYDDEHADYAGKPNGKRRGADTNRRVFEWLDSKPAEPFFLFVHYNDPHLPYDPPAPFGKQWVEGYTGRLTPALSGAALERNGRPIDDLTDADVDYLRGLYDGEIHYTDTQIALLRRRLAGQGTARSTLTVLTADHGEEFLEHGSGSHGYTLYDEQLRVPLLLHQPGVLAPRRVDAQVGHVDLLPTLLDLVGLEDRPAMLQGRSRAGLLRGKAAEGREPAYAEAPYLESAQAVRLPELKRIEFPERGEAREFDLAADPGETRELPAGTAPELKRLLEDWAAANAALAERLAARGREAGEVELDAETIERLRSLGYID